MPALQSADIDAGRLEVARKLGATHTLLVGKCDPKTTAKEIHQTLGEQPNKTIECSGAESAIATGIYVSYRIIMAASVLMVIILKGNGIRWHSCSGWIGFK